MGHDRDHICQDLLGLMVGPYVEDVVIEVVSGS